MKKKLLFTALLVTVPVAAGLWLLVRRGPVVAAPSDAPAAFQTESFGAGILFRYSDNQTPLRALKWLPPQSDGIQALQVVTQNDRQRLIIFKDGKQIADSLIARPAGIREGFFNFAELPEAIVLPDLAILLYRSANPSAGELPVVVAQNLATGELRWVHRAAGEHLVLAPDAKDGAVYLYGPTSPVLRLPLALQKGEQVGPTPFRLAAKAMDMPEEIKLISDFLPTGPKSFLLAHSAGLSSYSGNKEWKHWPMPTPSTLTYADARSVLAESKGYWWQPFPGKLIQVKSDGMPAGAETHLPEPVEPWSKDRDLLRLRGADPFGNLWFSLASPITSSPVATPEPPGNPEPAPTENQESAAAERSVPKPETPSAPVDTREWETYLSLGMDRVYRWNPERRVLQSIDISAFWAALTYPPGMNRPASPPALLPGSGAVVVESGSTAWRIPLETLFKSGN